MIEWFPPQPMEAAAHGEEVVRSPYTASGAHTTQYMWYGKEWSPDRSWGLAPPGEIW